MKINQQAHELQRTHSKQIITRHRVVAPSVCLDVPTREHSVEDKVMRKATSSQCAISHPSELNLLHFSEHMHEDKCDKNMGKRKHRRPVCSCAAVLLWPVRVSGVGCLGSLARDFGLGGKTIAAIYELNSSCRKRMVHITGPVTRDGFV
jgi:hypothetical protein